MKTAIRRRLIITFLAVLVVYIVASFGLAYSYLDAGNFRSLSDAVLDTLGGLAIPALVVLAVASQLSTYKFFTQRTNAQANSVFEDTGHKWSVHGVGVNGMPLDEYGNDPMGNHMGMESGSIASHSDD